VRGQVANEGLAGGRKDVEAQSPDKPAPTISPSPARTYTPAAGVNGDEMKTLPHSLEAEAALLGSLILDPALLGDAHAKVKPEMLYLEQHSVIYSAMLRQYMKSAGKAVDIVLVRDELKAVNKLEMIGGVEYLRKLAESVPSSANWSYYAQIVITKSSERTMITSAEKLLERLYDPTIDERTKIGAFEQALLEISPDSHNEITHIGDGLINLISEIEKRQENKAFTGGISTGFAEIDDYIGGLRPGNLYIIGARPAMGKSALAQNMAESASAEGHACLVFSLEMAKVQWQERLISSQAKVSSNKLLHGALGASDWTNVVNAASAISSMPIYLADVPELTPAKILTDSIRYRHRHNIKVIFVDYMQLMTSGQRHGNREAEIAYISRSMKLLARKLNLPVVVLCQLSRKCEERTDKRPMLSDLRESGSIEQDADVVILLYRDDYYTKPITPTNVTEAIIAKVRGCPTGVVKLRTALEFFRFENAI
jgi:replicative DNA helicase